jgi:hypothetical protein
VPARRVSHHNGDERGAAPGALWFLTARESAAPGRGGRFRTAYGRIETGDRPGDYVAMATLSQIDPVARKGGLIPNRSAVARRATCDGSAQATAGTSSSSRMP